jgi:hypothetical protein
VLSLHYTRLHALGGFEKFKEDRKYQTAHYDVLVYQVANVAQTSLKRLQRVVKEKDELILALQEASASAYTNVVRQKQRDQDCLEKLHKMFLTREDNKPLDMKDSLQVHGTCVGLILIL